jgi:predicted nuclease with TOPRIM domain
LENAKISEEKKEIQVAFSKAQEKVTSLHGENSHLSRIRDQLTTDKVTLGADSDKLNSEMREQE